MALVQDKSYDLHNTDENYANEGKAGMLQQTRKEDLMETMLDPEITKTRDFRV